LGREHPRRENQPKKIGGGEIYPRKNAKIRGRKKNKSYFLGEERKTSSRREGGVEHVRPGGRSFTPTRSRTFTEETEQLSFTKGGERSVRRSTPGGL